MGDFFGSIYCMFEDMFGLELADYLWGDLAPQQQTNMFIGIGLVMLVLSFALCAVYYYALNHPRLNNWWGWSIFLGVNAVANLIYGWQRVLGDYYDGLMVKKSQVTGQMLDLNITESDIFSFGVANMLISILAFIIISYSIKWWSSSCSRAPF